METQTDDTITTLNLRNTRMEVSAGKIIRLEISRVPMILMPITITIAVSTESKVLYTPTFTPVALANVSSKVIANIL